MEELLAVLNDRKAVGYLATVDNGKPRVRPWGFMFEDRGRFYFCTASNKEVYRQLTAVPWIEFSKTNQDMVWVRISGQIQFDESLQVKERIFAIAPMLQGLYQSPDNPVFKVFYLEHGRAAVDDFSPNPARTIEF